MLSFSRFEEEHDQIEYKFILNHTHLSKQQNHPVWEPGPNRIIPPYTLRQCPKKEYFLCKSVSWVYLSRNLGIPLHQAKAESHHQHQQVPNVHHRHAPLSRQLPNPHENAEKRQAGPRFISSPSFFSSQRPGDTAVVLHRHHRPLDFLLPLLLRDEERNGRDHDLGAGARETV